MVQVRGRHRLEETPRSVSICATAILEGDLFVVPDLRADPRFHDNPLVVDEPHVRFYAGAVLRTPEGLPLGTVCVLGHEPRPQGLKEGQAFTLRVLARQVMTQMQLRRAIRGARKGAARTGRRASSDQRERGALSRHRRQRAGADLGDLGARVRASSSISPTRISLASPYDEALVFDWRQLVHADELARILKEQVAGESSGATFTLEAKYKRADGEWRWLRSVSQPRLGPHGERNGFIGIAHDITSSKQAEHDLQQMNQLLEDRVARGARPAGPNRGDAAPIAEDGSRRSAHRRHRARFQQSARRNCRLARSDAHANFAGAHGRARPLSGWRDDVGQSRRLADASPARLLAPPAARTDACRRERADRLDGRAPAPHDAVPQFRSSSGSKPGCGRRSAIPISSKTPSSTSSSMPATRCRTEGACASRRPTSISAATAAAR